MHVSYCRTCLHERWRLTDPRKLFPRRMATVAARATPRCCEKTAYNTCSNPFTTWYLPRIHERG